MDDQPDSAICYGNADLERRHGWYGICTWRPARERLRALQSCQRCSWCAAVVQLRQCRLQWDVRAQSSSVYSTGPLVAGYRFEGSRHTPTLESERERVDVEEVLPGNGEDQGGIALFVLQPAEPRDLWRAQYPATDGPELREGHQQPGEYAAARAGAVPDQLLAVLNQRAGRARPLQSGLHVLHSGECWRSSS